MGRNLILTLVRHGETTQNVQRLLQGHTNTPLSEVGIKQAELLGRRIASEKFTKAYSSDLTRAYHTAQIVLNHSGNEAIEIEKDERLRERCYGHAEGKPARELFEEAKKRNLHVHDYTPEEGEQSSAVIKRADSFFKNLCNLIHDNGIDENILVVTHGGWIQYFLKHLHESKQIYELENFNPEKGIRIHKNTATTRLIIRNGNVTAGQKLSISFAEVNEASHLEELKLAIVD